ncbi:MAG: sigma 54-interacting transcriptional regulator, partial [Victivallaceae bacterium]|nr:sigma 54-interacting transcriptional regulator [Victivallaceae bacterium]
MGGLLFIDDDNACRSQLAEAFAREKAPEKVNIVSAGITSTQINPLVVQVLREVGIGISARRQTKSLVEIEKEMFDVAVALGSFSYKNCPVLPGNPAVINWDLPRFRPENRTPEEKLAFLRQLRDKIRDEVENFFDNGYFAAFVAAKIDSQLVLDNISDAIIAHDLNRNIYYFNQAAEKLTGYKREEVLNRDCHKAFGKPLCGDQCAFFSLDCCRDVPESTCRTIQLTNKKEQKRICEMTTTLMRDNQHVKKGILVVMRDLSAQQNLSKLATAAERIHGIIGASPAIMEVVNAIPDIAGSRAPALICGESGTGKELVARAIHQQSPRRNKFFVPLNCGA